MGVRKRDRKVRVKLIPAKFSLTQTMSDHGTGSKIHFVMSSVERRLVVLQKESMNVCICWYAVEQLSVFIKAFVKFNFEKDVGGF